MWPLHVTEAFDTTKGLLRSAILTRNMPLARSRHERLLVQVLDDPEANADLQVDVAVVASLLRYSAAAWTILRHKRYSMHINSQHEVPTCVAQNANMCCTKCQGQQPDIKCLWTGDAKLMQQQE